MKQCELLPPGLKQFWCMGGGGIVCTEQLPGGIRVGCVIITWM